uniref:mitogen-activated protein kinase kinase n=1 Tax=Acrobeloides nanus TaxID=290746 RepID=A0A914BUA4_9BILA
MTISFITQAGVNDLVNRTPFNEYTQMLREFIQRCLSPVITNRTYEMLMETDFYNNSKEPSESIVNKYIEEYNSKNRELNTIVERGMTAPPTALKKLENNPKEVYEQETFTINIDDVKELRTIYARRNTQVIEGSYELGDGRMLAIKKRFFKSHTTKPQDKKDRFLYEIKICKKLIKSPFITYLYAYDIKDTEASLCMELMDMNLKELYQKFHARSNSFPEKLLGCILYSVLNALSYCHKNEVVHCDLKPTNILINKGGRIKLTDFGSAIDLNKPYDRIGGTMAYWPRELTNDEKARLNPKRDIWSLGITLSESLLGRLPYLKQGEHPPEGYEVFKYLIKIDDAKDFTDIGNPFEDFIEQSPFYSEFTRVGYTISVIKFISECLQFVDDIPSLDKLQEMDFYRTCPTDRDEVFRITKSYLDELLDVPNIATLGFRSDLSPHDQTQIFDTQEETETDDSLLVPLKCDELLLSIRYHCRHFRTFKDLLNEPDKLQQYSKIVHEYYNTKLLTDTPAYKHFSAPKGLAIIINEIEWTPKPEKKRFGSEIDAQKMEKLLTDLENKDDRVDCLMVDSVAGEVHESDGLCLGKLPESSSKRSTLNSSADIPNYADIFEFYATAPYDVAHRDPQSGSEFINSLCKIFYAHAHRYHFSDMAKRIWGIRLKNKKYKEIDSRVDRDPNYYKRIHFRLSKTIP